MKKIIVSIALLLTISACTNYKTKNIVSLTNPLHPDRDYKEKIVLSNKIASQKVTSFRLNNVHLSQRELSDKMKFAKVKLPHDISAEPLIIGDKIFVLCSNGSLFAFDKNTYKQLWKTYISNKRVKTTYQGGGIAYDKGRLYVTNGSQNLAILNAENGKRYTVKSFDDILNHAPIISDDKIFVLTFGNQLYALDKGSLVLVWDHAGITESITYGKSKSYIALDYKNRIFVSYPSGHTLMLNPKDGSKIWDLHFASESVNSKYFPANIVVQPIFDGKHLYIADARGKLHKYDLQNNSKIWEVKVSDIQTMNKSGNAIFITNNRRQAAAISDKNGKILWVTDLVNDVKAYLKSDEEAKEIAEANELDRQERALLIQRNQAEKKPIKVENESKASRFFSKLTSKFKKSDEAPVKYKERKAKHHYNYDISKQKPINVLKAYIMNDNLVLFTEKGVLYHIDAKDGSLLLQKHIKNKYSFIVLGDRIIFAHNDKLFYEK